MLAFRVLELYTLAEQCCDVVHPRCKAPKGGVLERRGLRGGALCQEKWFCGRCGASERLMIDDEECWYCEAEDFGLCTACYHSDCDLSPACAVAEPQTWDADQHVWIRTEDKLESAVVLGPSSNPGEMRVRFSDGVEAVWDTKDFRDTDVGVDGHVPAVYTGCGLLEMFLLDRTAPSCLTHSRIPAMLKAGVSRVSWLHALESSSDAAARCFGAMMRADNVALHASRTHWDTHNRVHTMLDKHGEASGFGRENIDFMLVVALITGVAIPEGQVQQVRYPRNHNGGQAMQVKSPEPAQVSVLRRQLWRDMLELYTTALQPEEALMLLKSQLATYFRQWMIRRFKPKLEWQTWLAQYGQSHVEQLCPVALLRWTEAQLRQTGVEDDTIRERLVQCLSLSNVDTATDNIGNTIPELTADLYSLHWRHLMMNHLHDLWTELTVIQRDVLLSIAPNIPFEFARQRNSKALKLIVSGCSAWIGQLRIRNDDQFAYYAGETRKLSTACNDLDLLTYMCGMRGVTHQIVKGMVTSGCFIACNQDPVGGLQKVADVCAEHRWKAVQQAKNVRNRKVLKVLRDAWPSSGFDHLDVAPAVCWLQRSQNKLQHCIAHYQKVYYCLC
eukprot:COSAG06_NODE_93_length_24652_cov_1832.353399_6_plen_614_part_00